MAADDVREPALMRCPAHGLIEATTELSWMPENTTSSACVEHICPVSTGEDGTCGLTLDRAERLLAREDVERVLREQAAAARSLIDECRHKLDGYGEARQLVTLLALNSVAERLGLDIDNHDGREDG